jgi:betaine reductase
MAQKLKVVHYLNQFFGGIGAEEKASEGPKVQAGVIGPGRALQEIVKDRGEVVATVICGDNYFTEKTELIKLMVPYQPDILIAGPAFNAGRYGVACGALCAAVQEKLGIPAVTAMYQENPGVGLYKKDIYIIKTADSAKDMGGAITKMAGLAIKLVDKKEIGSPDKEGYFPRGMLKLGFAEKTTAERAVDMLVAKLQGKPFETELHLPEFERVKPPAPVKNLASAKIALVTDGGLVPKGNPDNIESLKATRFGMYSIKNIQRLNAQDYDVVHVGYDTKAVKEDPQRLVPLDVLRDMEKEKILGKIDDIFYTTTGVATPLENSRKIGRGIAERLKQDRVDAVILTST